MTDRIDRCWRVIATGFSFSLFGLAGLVLGTVLFPLVRLLVREDCARVRLSRSIIAWTFRQFVDIMRGLGVLHYELHGFEKLGRDGMIVLANHPSLIDTVFLLGFVPNSTCVVDEVLFRNSFTVGPMRAAGFIRNNSGPNVLDQCLAALDAGTNVLIFPEGTRTPLSGAIRLRRGAANIAVRAVRDLTPVIIHCTPRMLVKGDRWWQVPERPGHYSLRVGDDISVRRFSASEPSRALAVRRLTDYLEQYFTTESQAHAAP